MYFNLQSGSGAMHPDPPDHFGPGRLPSRCYRQTDPVKAVINASAFGQRLLLSYVPLRVYPSESVPSKGLSACSSGRAVCRCRFYTALFIHFLDLKRRQKMIPRKSSSIIKAIQQPFKPNPSRIPRI